MLRAKRRIADMSTEEIREFVLDSAIRDMRDWYPELQREHLYINYAANLLAERHLKECLGVHPQVDQAVHELVAGLLLARPGIEDTLRERDAQRKADWQRKKQAQRTRQDSPQ